VTAAEARQRAIAKVQALYDEAQAQSADRYWQNGPYNVKRWVARGFGAALAELKVEPADGETAEQYARRISDKVRAWRGNGPDEDDESWYDSAIDEAAIAITVAARD
jgi:hypothetical protein